LITKVEIKNFQCHKDTEIVLDQITVLVGDNDVGKSAVLRAVKWCAFNKWDGKANDHITWGAEESEVRITCEKGIVTRRKGQNSNSYTITQGEKEKELKAFGVIQPKEVDAILGLDLDNFQDQDAPAFWLMLNSGEAASALNEIFNLTDIDNAVKSISSDLRQVRAKEKVCLERLQEAKDAKRRLSWVPEAVATFKELESVVQAVKETDLAIQEEEERLQSFEEALLIKKNAEKLLDKGEAALALWENIIALTTELSDLEVVASTMEKQCQRKEMLARKEKKLKKALAGKCPLCLRS